MRIDAHQHFWIYDTIRDNWITTDMEIIRRNFLPTDIAPLLKENQIDAVVAVQADQSPEETQFLIDLSSMYAMIKAVVGWVDLQSENIDELLAGYAQFPIVKGFRHIVEAESDSDFLMRAEVQRGIKALTKRGYTYDLLIRPQHYSSTLACVAANPEQVFILDHIAKPPIKSQEFTEWATFIAALAAFPNVSCKISGLATEADWKNWHLDHFRQYIDQAVASFGTQRILFGSDWPVCLLAASYAQNIEIVQDKLGKFTQADLDAFWGENASRIYNI